jgi:7-cyano-7-deazaguanine synthase in queuosine biosynthesis
MSLKEDLQELEGSKFTEQCNTCIFKPMKFSDNWWCYMFEAEPTGKCPECMWSQNKKEAQMLNELFKNFPELDT